MLKLILKYLLYLCAFVSIVMLLPGSVLLDIKPTKFLYPLPKSLTGPLDSNERLAQTAVLFDKEIYGPESLATFGGKVVTGAADGYLYQIDGNNMKRLVTLVEKSCALNMYNATKCGRPLGLKFDSKGILWVVEPHVGVFSVENVFAKNPKVNLVLDIDETEVLGKPSKFLDDLAIEEGAGTNGGHVLYISDVSVKFNLYQSNLIIMGSDTGRLIRYDINAKKLESVLDNLLFPNGVEINDDKTAVFVNEFVARQVIKVYINGPKKGQSEPLIKHLPGEPDNIRRSATKKETYWLALLNGRTSSRQSELDYYLRKPLLRKLICRLMHLVGSGVQAIGTLSRLQFIAEYGHEIKNGKPLSFLLFSEKSVDERGMIIEVDANGQVVQTLQASDRRLTRLSEVREVKVSDTESVLYIGSYINPYLGKLTIKR